MSQPQRILISNSAVGNNPFLSPDGLLNVDAVVVFGKEIDSQLKKPALHVAKSKAGFTIHVATTARDVKSVVAKEHIAKIGKSESIKGTEVVIAASAGQKVADDYAQRLGAMFKPTPSGVVVVPLRGKTAAYDSRKAKAGEDLKYLARRAVKVQIARRPSQRARVIAPMFEGANAEMFGKLAPKFALLQKAVASHQKQQEKMKGKLKGARESLRAEREKAYGKAIKVVSKFLTGAGIKDTQIRMSKGMAGKTMLLKLDKDTVVSIGLSNVKAFNAAVEDGE